MEIVEAEVITIEDAATAHHVDPQVMRQFVMDGDLSKIPPRGRPEIVMALCRHIGVDPLERPFMVLRDGKREVLYATRACTSALCRQRRISREIVSVEERTVGGQPMIVAKARATMLSTGRYDEATGVVAVMQADVEWENGRKTVKGWRLPDPSEACNLPMKAETKAKRRAVLDLVGLGITDESEIETIKGARVAHLDMTSGEIRSIGPAGDPAPERVSAERGTAIEALLAKVSEAMGVEAGKVLAAAAKKAGLRGVPESVRVLTAEDGETIHGVLVAKLAELEFSAKPPSPKEAVLAEWRQLCEAGHFDNRDWKRTFAQWAGLDVWPDRATDEDWAATHKGVAAYLDEITREMQGA